MSSNEMITALKIGLGIVTEAYDTRLEQLLLDAAAQVRREGVDNLNTDNLDDATTVIMYADWMWRKRDTMEGMPRMLRWRLNNRIMARKAQ